MKNIRRLVILLLVLTVAALFAACGISDKGRTDPGTDEGSALSNAIQTIEEADEQDKPDAEAKKDESSDVIDDDLDEPEEEEDELMDEEEDPANVDPTVGDDGSSDDDVQRRYIGTWTLKGIEFSDGSFEDAGKCTVEVLRDGSYTMTGKLSGEKVDRKGQWSISEKKKLVLDDDTLGVNDEGYLLMYSGQRDGKGYKLYYAFQRN